MNMTAPREESVRPHDWPGLTDAVHDAQQRFRRLLGCMSEPGTLTSMALPSLPPGAAISSAAWGTLLSLCDLETRVWIDATLSGAGLAAALAFHTGARVTPDPADADFALVTPTTLTQVEEFALGSDAWPDRSTTLIVMIETIESQGDWQLCGPGVPGERRLGLGDPDQVRPLMRVLHANRGRFPRGLDAFITCGTQLTAIARSTRLSGPGLEQPELSSAREEIA